MRCEIPVLIVDKFRVKGEWLIKKTPPAPSSSQGHPICLKSNLCSEYINMKAPD